MQGTQNSCDMIETEHRTAFASSRLTPPFPDCQMMIMVGSAPDAQCFYLVLDPIMLCPQSTAHILLIAPP